MTSTVTAARTCRGDASPPAPEARVGSRGTCRLGPWSGGDVIWGRFALGSAAQRDHNRSLFFLGVFLEFARNNWESGTYFEHFRFEIRLTNGQEIFLLGGES